jgi:hypothetical protein
VKIGANFEGRSGVYVASVGFGKNAINPTANFRNFYMCGFQYEYKDAPTTHLAESATRTSAEDLSGNDNDGLLTSATFTNNAFTDDINWGASHVQVNSSDTLYASNNRTIEM